ncbi:MAG TPA: VOC family protein [Gaiellaceae bacterium]
MVYEKPSHAPATFTVLNFRVDDIETTVDRLQAAGVGFRAVRRGAFADRREGHRDARPRQAWFKDPAGNILSVLQET